MSKATIDDLLTEGHKRFTPLQRLLRQAANQDGWTKELQAVLPEPLRRDCRVSAVRGNALIILCSNGATATRLRFLLPELLPKLTVLAHFQHITELRIKISHSETIIPNGVEES
ncbi:MAG: DUF721 domain-containing protein [Thermoguttaceae bacterium]